MNRRPLRECSHDLVRDLSLYTRDRDAPIVFAKEETIRDIGGGNTVAWEVAPILWGASSRVASFAGGNIDRAQFRSGAGAISGER